MSDQEHDPTECEAYHSLVVDFGGTKPIIATLCGSSRFMDEFIRVQRELTLNGVLVISLGMFGQSEDPPLDYGTDEAPSTLKTMLDELHFRKIDLADMVYVVNKDGYIGTSTRREIDYAADTDKQIVYMEPLDINMAHKVGEPV